MENTCNSAMVTKLISWTDQQPSQDIQYVARDGPLYSSGLGERKSYVGQFSGA